MGIKTVPHRRYSPDFAPCDFCLFPKLRGCRYETIIFTNPSARAGYDTRSIFKRSLTGLNSEFSWWGDERGCDEGHWHAHTRGLPWGTPEVIVTVQQVHCSRRRLLRRGLEFHVRTINKSAHTKKVWKLIVCSSYIEHMIFKHIF